jgi:hypothetical protein
VLLRIETYSAPAWEPGADEVTVRSGVGDGGADQGPAPVGTEGPVGHGACDELFELVGVDDALQGGGGQRFFDDGDDRLASGVVVDEAAGQEIGGLG